MPVSFDPPAEQPDLGGIERLAAPLVGILAEDLQRLAAVDERAIHRLRHPAGDRHVRADPEHYVNSTAARYHLDVSVLSRVSASIVAVVVRRGRARGAGCASCRDGR